MAAAAATTAIALVTILVAIAIATATIVCAGGCKGATAKASITATIAPPTAATTAPAASAASTDGLAVKNDGGCLLIRSSAAAATAAAAGTATAGLPLAAAVCAAKCLGRAPPAAAATSAASGGPASTVSVRVHMLLLACEIDCNRVNSTLTQHLLPWPCIAKYGRLLGARVDVCWHGFARLAAWQQLKLGATTWHLFCRDNRCCTCRGAGAPLRRRRRAAWAGISSQVRCRSHCHRTIWCRCQVRQRHQLLLGAVISPVPSAVTPVGKSDRLCASQHASAARHPAVV
eukprot:351270-Chlamydomonas_euryale.AAC.4